MASIFITGSSDGIGKQTAANLVRSGHRVVVHARNEERAAALAGSLAGTEAVLVSDLASLRQTKQLAAQAKDAGPFDVVVHNAGIGSHRQRRATEDGLEQIFQVNVLAPYVLTALMDRPERLVYLSSGLQANGEPDLGDLQWEKRHWQGGQAYSDSKLYDIVLAFAVARLWPGVLANAVDPGWVKTKMGGAGAPETLDSGADTPVWLATSDEPGALVSGKFFKHRRELKPHPATRDIALQDALVEECGRLSGVRFTPG